MRLTDHFLLSEFAARNTAHGPEVLPTGEVLENVRALAAELEVLRLELGGPIVVISGYRTPEHNARVGGAPASQHLLGKAADIRVAGVPPEVVAATIEKMIADGRMRQGGVGRYATFTHYDIRGVAARWKG